MPKVILDPWQIPTELEYMLTLAAGTCKTPPPQTLDWALFRSFTAKNRLENTIAAEAAKLPFPREELEALQATSFQQTLQTTQQIRFLAFVIKDFREAGIRALSLKGPLLAAQLYGDPSLRYSSDLDILVAEEDYPAARDRLLANGFTECLDVHHKTEKRRRIKEALGEEMHGIFFKDGIYVELHWRLSFRYPVAFADLWANRQTKQLLGQEVCCLGQQDNLTYLICHAVGHGFCRLRWLIDLYRIFKNQTVNYAALFRQMALLDVGDFLLETLLLMYQLPGFQMPAIVSEQFSIRKESGKVYFSYQPQIRDTAKKACLLLQLLRPLIIRPTPPEGIAERNYLHLLPVVGKKITIFRYLRKMSLPQRDELNAFDLPDRLYFLYYIIRPFHKLWQWLPFSGKHR